MDDIQTRLNKIEGQLTAIKRMYEEERSCDEIVQQVQAVRAALGKVSVKLLSGEAEKCAKEGKLQKFNSVVEKTFKYV